MKKNNLTGVFSNSDDDLRKPGVLSRQFFAEYAGKNSTLNAQTLNRKVGFTPTTLDA